MPPIHFNQKPLRHYLSRIVLGSSLISLGILIAPAIHADHHESPPARFFELRTYTTHDGKLGALHDRFRQHTNDLFVKHGMDLVGYWTPTDEKLASNTLVYILAYPSEDDRKKSWQGFLDDPDWQAAYKASHADGPIVSDVESQFLVPTDYSPIR